MLVDLIVFTAAVAILAGMILASVYIGTAIVEGTISVFLGVLGLSVVVWAFALYREWVSDRDVRTVGKKVETKH